MTERPPWWFARPWPFTELEGPGMDYPHTTHDIGCAMGVDCDCGAEPDDELDDELLVEALEFMASVLFTDRASGGMNEREMLPTLAPWEDGDVLAVWEARGAEAYVSECDAHEYEHDPDALLVCLVYGWKHVEDFVSNGVDDHEWRDWVANRYVCDLWRMLE